MFLDGRSPRSDKRRIRRLISFYDEWRADPAKFGKTDGDIKRIRVDIEDKIKRYNDLYGGGRFEA